MKRFIPVFMALVMIFVMFGCSSGKEINEEQTTKETLTQAPVSSTTDSYADEGLYFCMGKKDTCQKKTTVPEDFFCSSCDPDGDNKEG